MCMYVMYVHTQVCTPVCRAEVESNCSLLRLCRRPEEKGGKLIGKCDKMKLFREKFAHQAN